MSLAFDDPEVDLKKSRLAVILREREDFTFFATRFSTCSDWASLWLPLQVLLPRNRERERGRLVEGRGGRETGRV